MRFKWYASRSLGVIFSLRKSDIAPAGRSDILFAY